MPSLPEFERWLIYQSRCEAELELSMPRISNNTTIPTSSSEKTVDNKDEQRFSGLTKTFDFDQLQNRIRKITIPVFLAIETMIFD